MAKIIFTSSYHRNLTRENVGGLIRYIATRESVEKVAKGFDHSPATVRQKRLIGEALKIFPNSMNYEEYKEYSAELCKSNATNYLSAVIQQNDVSGMKHFMHYIAERPSVEKLGSHGLFSQADDKIDLDAVAEEVNHHNGIIFTHVVSLRREDAERLGYCNATAWRDLVRRNVAEIAEAHNISLSNLQWYAGFHNKDHHPHIHLVVYSKDGKQGWITKKSIEDMRSLFGNDIFHNEQYKLFQMETQQRDEVKSRVKELLNYDFIYEYSPHMAFLFETLQAQLNMVSGKKIYGYLPKEVKNTVNKIVAELAKDESVAELYAEWCKINREKLSLYYEKKEPDVPLENNKEFRSLKNAVIQAVLQMGQAQIIDGQRVHYKDIYGHLFKFFLRIFQSSYDKHAQKLDRQMDKKLRTKIEEKKVAHGLKSDSSSYENDLTM